MLTDCDLCVHLEECSLDPQKQLKSCWRYKSFLEELHQAIDNLEPQVGGDNDHNKTSTHPG